MNNVLLIGPKLDVKGASYGGGVGGYTRNMLTYIECFEHPTLNLVPMFHSVRKKNFNFPVLRLLADAFVLIRLLVFKKPVGVHILAQYRGAIVREYVWAVILRLWGVPYIYDVKAGVFIEWDKSGGRVQKYFVRYILSNASCVFCEGRKYLNYLKREYSCDAEYWPNFLSSRDVPHFALVRKQEVLSVIKILFVGYCYEGKGVYELVSACDKVSRNGVDIQLSLMGQESSEFSDWLNCQVFQENMSVLRYGKVDNDSVLSALQNNDIFCLPTKHAGEGHSNVINEAMMCGIPIVCTRHGFLEDILPEGCCVFIDSENPLENIIAELNISSNLRFDLGRNARAYFLDSFQSSIAIPKLTAHYMRVFMVSK